MLHVETANTQLDGKAAVTKGLPVPLSQEFVEGTPQAVSRPRHQDLPRGTEHIRIPSRLS
jgi:hypothetical protein